MSSDYTVNAAQAEILQKILDYAKAEGAQAADAVFVTDNARPTLTLWQSS